MTGLGLLDGTRSGFGAAFAARVRVSEPTTASILLVVLPFGGGDERTDAVLHALGHSGPGATPIMGCVWVVDRSDRFDASLAWDSCKRTFENHSRFLTASGWNDLLTVNHGDMRAALHGYAVRSRHIMELSSNQLRAGTSTQRVLEHVDRVPTACSFLVAEAYAPGEWHGLEAVVAFAEQWAGQTPPTQASVGLAAQPLRAAVVAKHRADPVVGAIRCAFAQWLRDLGISARSLGAITVVLTFVIAVVLTLTLAS